MELDQVASNEEQADKALKQLVEICKGDYISVDRLQSILKNFPETIYEHGDDCTLLHHACFNEHVTLEIIKYLAELYPEAVKHQTGYGWLPLHRACLNPQPNLPIIQYLVHQYPEALMVHWSEFGPPLHCLFYETYRNVPLSVVEVLADSCPEAIREQTANGETAIHLACQSHDVSLSVVRVLVEREPEALAMAEGFHGDLPLHTLFRRWGSCPPLDVVQYLVEQNPQMLSFRAGHSLPLHLACRHLDCTTNIETSLKVIQLLVRENPASLHARTEFGNLPLHEACLNDKITLLIVRHLSQEYPASIQIQNSLGMLPLHYASWVNLDVSRFLVEEYPESVRVQDHDSCYPLHVASRNAPLGNIKYFIELFPVAVSRRDRNGNLPLHKACENQKSLPIFELLLFLYPEAIRETNSLGELPFHILFKSSISPPLQVLRFFHERLRGGDPNKDEQWPPCSAPL